MQSEALTTGLRPEMPAVAVVVPAFNPGPQLTVAVSSALEQTLSEIELVVVDDGSDPDRFPALPLDPRLSVVRQPNSGVSRARNRGVEETSASFVAFLDADDLWEPTKLAEQLMGLAARPQAVLSHTGFRLIDPRGRELGPGWAAEVRDYRSLLEMNPVMMSSVVVRREAFIRTGGFDPAYSVAADWDLWLRLARIGPFAFVPRSLASYRIGPHTIGQMSGDVRRGYLDIMSIYDRQTEYASAGDDNESLAAISRGRTAARRSRAAEAGERFADSLRETGRHAEWDILRVGLRISPLVALRAAGRRVMRQVAHYILRRVGRRRG